MMSRRCTRPSMRKSVLSISDSGESCTDQACGRLLHRWHQKLLERESVAKLLELRASLMK